MRVIRHRGFVASAVVAVLFIATSLVSHALRQQPDFYEQALHESPQEQRAAGSRMEQQVLELHQEMLRTGHWEAKFTEEEINGWLAYSLPEKFGRQVPPGVDEPRVAVKDGSLHFACRYRNKKIGGVLSLILDVKLTEEPNELAVCVRRVRLGILPIPLDGFLDKIASTSRKIDLPLRWQDEAAGDPIALIEIPRSHESYAHQQITIETLELRDGTLYVAGRTERPNSRHIAYADGGVRNVALQR